MLNSNINVIFQVLIYWYIENYGKNVALNRIRIHAEVASGIFVKCLAAELCLLERLEEVVLKGIFHVIILPQQLKWAVCHQDGRKGPPNLLERHIISTKWQMQVSGRNQQRPQTTKCEPRIFWWNIRSPEGLRRGSRSGSHAPKKKLWRSLKVETSKRRTSKTRFAVAMRCVVWYQFRWETGTEALRASCCCCCCCRCCCYYYYWNMVAAN